MKEGDVIVVIQVERFDDGWHASMYADGNLMMRSHALGKEEALALSIAWKREADAVGGTTEREQ